MSRKVIIGGVEVQTMYTIAIGVDGNVRTACFGEALNPDGSSNRSMCYQLLGYGLELLLVGEVEKNLAERGLLGEPVEGGNGSPKKPTFALAIHESGVLR